MPDRKMNCRILNLMVAMRDGVKLHTAVYLPDDEGTHPVILVRNAYSSKNTIPAPSEYYLGEGIIYILQDCRGTGQSEGVFYPWHAEINDGEDCLKWVAAQSWCNGRIAMDGGSYSGLTQWLAAFSSNPALVGVAPHVAPCNFHESPNYIGGAFCLKLNMQWGLGNHHRNGGYPEFDFNWEKLAWHLPLKDIDRESGLREVDFWRDWLNHSAYDRYWEQIDLNKHCHRIKVPACIGGGWFDMYSRGVLESFAGMQAHAGTERARRFTRCIMGPWTHGALVKTMNCGDNAKMEEMHKTRARFIERMLKDPESDPLPGEPALKYFMMGLNEWRASDTWPVKNTRPVEYYLHSTGTANTRFGAGLLNEIAPGHEQTDCFIYDPRNPVPTNGGCVHCLPSGVFDQTQVEERVDVLVFTTAALQANVEVVGNVRLTLYAASTAPDTDFTAKLIDVYPDGRALNVCDGIIRARYRKSMMTPTMLKAGELVAYDIDCWDTATCFREGHRIRLEVSSSNFPRFDRNPNTGHKLGEDAEVRIARQTIYHDARRPSRLILPCLDQRGGKLK